MLEIPIDFYAEIAAVLTLALVSIALLRSYFGDPEEDKRTLALSIGYVFFALASLAGLLGILLVLMNYPANAALALNVERFVYVFVAVGMVPFTYFVLNVFYRRKRWPTYLMTVFAIVLSTAYLFVQSSVVGESVTGSPTVWTTDPLSGLALLLMTLVGFSVLFVKSLQTAKKAENPLTKRRFRMIGLSAFFGVLTFVLSALDTFGGPLAPLISATSWSTAAVAGILSYFGWARFKGSKKGNA